MKIKHKNSGEVFDMNFIQYTKLFGMYGYLVMSQNQEIVFITSVEEQDFHYVTDDFEIVTT